MQKTALRASRKVTRHPLAWSRLRSCDRQCDVPLQQQLAASWLQMRFLIAFVNIPVFLRNSLFLKGYWRAPPVLCARPQSERYVRHRVYVGALGLC